jgi:hypothetical protein
MTKLGNNFTASSAPSFAAFFLLAILALVSFPGCRLGRHTSDSRLRQIDDMLDSRLPAGTTKSKVSFYLSSQGFPIQATNDSHALVAIVHHVDTETLRPETARVTFHFDARDNLTTYELAVAPSSGAQP